MNRVTQWAALMVICLVAVSAASAQKKPASKAFYTSGYYNGIEMTSKESGDYCCLSVYLTQTANDTYALITEAQGSIMDPVLVKAKMSGKDMRTIEFALPGDNGERKFKGTVSAAALNVTSNGVKSVLKRECGETYSNISGESGGMEVYVTDSGGNWFALVSIAEGEMAEPVLVKGEVTGKNYDKISFTVGERKFTGTRGKTALTLSEAGTRSVLKQKCYK